MNKLRMLIVQFLLLLAVKVTPSGKERNKLSICLGVYLRNIRDER